MASDLSETLPAEAQLALAYTPPILSNALRILLEFDQRLGRLVSATTEPMLGQMRLAWWRDALGMPVGERPKSDAVLDGLGAHWAGHEAPLIALVDGWEHMLSEPPIARASILAFARGRGEGIAGLADLSGSSGVLRSDLARAGEIWALADAASHMAEGEERTIFLEIGRGLERPGSVLPQPFRGVAVLCALARRSLKADGAPLMMGRGAALIALRAGMFGR